MLFYKINATVSNPEELPAIKDTDAKHAFGHVMSERSEAFLIKHKQQCLIFAAGHRKDRIRFCAILLTNKDVSALLAEYIKATPLSIKAAEVEEITFKAMHSMLKYAYRMDYISDDDEVIKAFGLADLENRCGIAFSESLIGKGPDKEGLILQARQMLAEDSLIPEIERIYASNRPARAEGHPVHYMLVCDQSEVRDRMSDLLLSALHARGRIKNRRYMYTDFGHQDEHDDWSIDTYEAMYKGCVGGAVLIRYAASDDPYEGSHARPGGEALISLSRLAVKYRHSVLTVFCLPTGAVKVKQELLEQLEALSLIELKEDLACGERASAYLGHLAKAAHVRPDKSLYAAVEPSDKSFRASDLQKIFLGWYDKKLRSTVYPQYQQTETARAALKKQKHHGSAIDELNGMVGLGEAKAVIARALNFYKMQKLYKDRGIPTDRPAMHMVFTGNPGTAKTTAARLFARIMRDNGLLDKGELYEVGRADLVGKYVGWTARIVKEKFKAARGSVLFIDEAYALCDDKEGLYGDEAINTIVQEMENNRENMVVIFAGYPDKMDAFLSRNPGLRSRIAFHVPFSDYSAGELCAIAELIARGKSLRIADDAKEKLYDLVNSARNSQDFGNGRYVRSLIEQARMEQAGRILAMDCDRVSEEVLCTLRAEDFIPPPDQTGAGRRMIGF